MTIQILGGGCPNCHNLAENAVEAGRRIGIAVEIEKVTDSDRIMEMGLLRTPAYAVGGKVKGAGRVFTVEEIIAEIES